MTKDSISFIRSSIKRREFLLISAGISSGCLGGSSTRKPIKNGFEDGVFNYFFDVNESTNHDWGIKKSKNIPGPGNKVAFVRQASGGRRNSIVGYSGNLFNLKDAKRIEFQFYSHSYDPNLPWNMGRFLVLPMDEKNRWPNITGNNRFTLELPLLSTDRNSDPHPFSFMGSVVDNQISNQFIDWEQGRWYKVVIDLVDEKNSLHAKGKIWNPETENEPSNYGAEALLSSSLGSNRRIGWLVSGRENPIELHYDYWKIVF